jgi:hypothetical protein
MKEVCVDHYPKPAGSILSVADIGEFANNLYCEVDNLRVLCVPCHKIHTLAEEQNISFEEARKVKEVLEMLKLPTKEILAFLEQHGYTGVVVSNATKRKELVTKILKGEQ